jgi:hypothetical protein
MGWCHRACWLFFSPRASSDALQFFAKCVINLGCRHLSCLVSTCMWGCRSSGLGRAAVRLPPPATPAVPWGCLQGPSDPCCGPLCPSCSQPPPSPHPSPPHPPGRLQYRPHAGHGARMRTCAVCSPVRQPWCVVGVGSLAGIARARTAALSGAVLSGVVVLMRGTRV